MEIDHYRFKKAIEALQFGNTSVRIIKETFELTPEAEKQLTEAENKFDPTNSLQNK